MNFIYRKLDYPNTNYKLSKNNNCKMVLKLSYILLLFDQSSFAVTVTTNAEYDNNQK